MNFWQQVYFIGRCKRQPWTSKKNHLLPQAICARELLADILPKIKCFTGKPPLSKGVGRFQSPAQWLVRRFCLPGVYLQQLIFLQDKCLPSRELTYPTLGKGKSSSNIPCEKDLLVPTSLIFVQLLRTQLNWKLSRLWRPQVQSKSITQIASSPQVVVNLFWKKHFLCSTFFFWNQDLVLFHWSHDKLHSHQEIRPTLIYDSSSQFCSRNSPKNPQSWNSPLFNTSTDGSSVRRSISPSPTGLKFHPSWDRVTISHTGSCGMNISFLVHRTGGPFWQCVCVSFAEKG